jgi:uncharacterized metal-binding protein
MSAEYPRCARCPYGRKGRCMNAGGKAPPACPTLAREALRERAKARYREPEIGEFARAAAVQEAAGYVGRGGDAGPPRPAKTRLEEIMEFSERMGYRRLGMAFCAGLKGEAEATEKIFSRRGFDVVSVVCKAGGVPKEEIGIGDADKIVPGGPESMCNPVLQAMVLNEEGTEFNILLGLCVGHDSLFFRHADAPCTVLAVKDRLLGHNPLAAVYNADSYYRYLK